MFVWKPAIATIFRPSEGKIWPTWPKIKSFLNTYLFSVYNIYEVDRVIIIDDNGLKPATVTIFRPPMANNKHFLPSHKVNYSVNL